MLHLGNKMELLIAMVGAITGISSLTIQTLTYFKDKPRLLVALEGNKPPNNPPNITLSVSNIGTKPTTILKARIIQENDLDYFKPRKPKRRIVMRTLFPQEPQLLMPGHHIVYSLPVRRITRDFPWDRPVVPFVINPERKIIRGRSQNMGDFLLRYFNR